MTYTGDVVVGGPADVRELPELSIRKLAVSEMNNNCYLLTCKATGEQLLIDAADDAPALVGLISSGGNGVNQIVTTHQHWDHHRALVDVVGATGAPTAAGEADADALPVPPDRRLNHGDTVTWGSLSLDVIHLRGHTPGSVALLFRSGDGSTHLFTGDSLFPGGPGKTWSEKDFASLMDDLQERVFDVLPDDTWFYPGHGSDSTLGAQRPHLSEWRERGW